MTIVRSGIRTLLIAAAMLLSTTQDALAADSAANQWVAIGPDGANVVALAIDPATPTTAYAATLGSGVLGSANGGATWSTLNQGLPTANVLALVVDPAIRSTLYAGTDAGIFKTTDHGGHWAAASAGLGDVTQVTVGALTIDPGSPATVYAGTSAGLFRTINGGVSWTPVNAGLAGRVARVITIDPTSPSTLYVGVDDVVDYIDYGVYKSTDAGANWIRIYHSEPYEDGGAPSAVALAVDPRAPSHLYLALGLDMILKSLDGGVTWTPLSSQRPLLTTLAVDPVSFATLYAGTYSGLVYRSTDAGDHWTPAASGLAASAINVIEAAPSGSATMYAGARNGLFRSADRGDGWTHLTLGVRTIGVGTVAVDPTAPSTIYTNAEGVVMKTIDGGAHWADSGLGLSGSVFLIAIDPVSPSTLYAGLGPDFGGGAFIYKSIDAGAHWAQTNLPTRGLQALAIAPSQPATLFIVVNFTGVIKTTDGGTSWKLVNDGLTIIGPNVATLVIDPTNAETVYAATDPTGPFDPLAKVFKSTDGAAHWKQLPVSPPYGANITRLVIDPVSPSTIYAVSNGATQGFVLKSSDGGENWGAAQTLLTGNVWTLAIDPHDPRQIYAATSAGVFTSADGAASWAPLNAGLPSLDVVDVAIDRSGTLLRAATSAGLFEYKSSGAPAPSIVSVVEYRHAAFGHYFITAIPDEIAKLDRGAFAGWVRTGLQFNAYGAPGAGTSPVCRFFSTSFAPKSSHFHSPFAFECSSTQADARWMLESNDVFEIGVPTADGSCGAGHLPVYRLYNNGQGGAPNHRYTTDAAVRAQMIAQGWMPEGLGESGVNMCAPS